MNDIATNFRVAATERRSRCASIWRRHWAARLPTVGVAVTIRKFPHTKVINQIDKENGRLPRQIQAAARTPLLEPTPAKAVCGSRETVFRGRTHRAPALPTWAIGPARVASRVPDWV